MNTSEIEKLLEKFYESKTSLEEEFQLKQFFLSGSVPPHLAIHAGQFQYYDENLKEEITDPFFEEKFLNKITTTPVMYLKPNRNRFFYISGIAAGILLLMGLFLTFREDVFTKQRKENLVSNPELIFNQTRSILMMVSLNFNKGIDEMHYLGQFDKAIQKMQYLGQFDKANQNIRKISKFYQYQTLIINQDQ